MADFNQTSFAGGMNLLVDDTRLQPNQYRVGFNIRNRYDVLDQIKKSSLDVTLKNGIIQELVTFGDYVVAFVSGKAYYRLKTDFAWQQITGFDMSHTAPRYWTVAVPISTTNYVRVAASLDSRGSVEQLNVASGELAGSIPGLLVQDNINQPQFIFIDKFGAVNVRTTQSFEEWSIDYSNNAVSADKREYVPIGNAMAWVDGILYVASQDYNSIYRSVSGRPLDFVVNVATDGQAGGDATTTSYSVGVGGISCLRGTSDGSLFVAASSSNFIVQKNMSPNAPTLFGEYTFIRKYLFESTCLNDRCIIDSLGDTRFIDLNGVRSFNAIQQLENEGQNAPFTATIAAAFKGIVQDVAAAILFDNYELYGMNTVYGPAIAVFDTINQCWSSFDVGQTGGSKIKKFARIDGTEPVLYAITEDNKLYQLYSSLDNDDAAVLTAGVVYAAFLKQNGATGNYTKSEMKVSELRVILNRITEDSTITMSLLVDNRMSEYGAITKTISYRPSPNPYNGTLAIPDVDNQLTNVYWLLANVEQGWKAAFLIQWTGSGSVTQFSITAKEQTPLNPPMTQSTTR